MAFNLKKITQSQGLRSAGLLTVGSVSATALSAVAMIIFSRLLGPADFGVFSVLFSLLLILSKIGDAGINIAVQREVARRKGDEAQDIATIQAGSALKLIIIFVLAGLGITASPLIGAHWLNIPDYIALVRWIFVLSGGVVLYEYINTVLQAKEFFGWSVISNFVQSALKLITAILVIYLGTSLGIITFIYLIIPILGGLVGFTQLPISYLYPKWERQQINKITSVAKWTGISILSATIADNVDIILVQNFLSSYDTGIWSAAVRISTLFSLIAWSIGTVLNVRVAKYHDHQNLKAYLKKALYIAIGSLVGVAALSLISKPLVLLTVGSAYLQAVSSLNLLMIANALMTAATPYIALFYLFDKPQYYAYAGILQTLVLVGGDYWLIPSMGIIGAGWVRIAVRLAVFIFTCIYARKAYAEKYTR